MTEKLYAPQIDRYVECFGRRGYNGNGDITYDGESYTFLNQFFDELHKITPISENGCRELFVCAERGGIEAFGNFDDWYDSDCGDTYEEFEQEWKAFYPKEKKWYHIVAIDNEDGYQAVVVNNRLVLEVRPSKEKGYPHDLKEFTQWLLESAKQCIRDIRHGTYMSFVRDNLPDEYKTGTILQSELWEIYPEDRTEFFEGLSGVT